MIIAPRTNAQVFIELDLGNDFVAAGTFLKKALRNVAFLARLGLDRWFLENGHGKSGTRSSRGIDRARASFFQNSRALAQGRAGG